MRIYSLVAVLVLMTGCGTFVTGLGHEVTVGAVDGLTNSDSKKKLDALGVEAAGAARDELLGTKTDADLQALFTQIGNTVGEELDELLTSVLAMRIREIIASALSALLGPATRIQIQSDLNAIIDSAAPHLAQALAQAIQAGTVPLNVDVTKIKADADAEAAAWKPIAIAFAIGTGFLVVVLVAGLFVLRSHRKVIEALTQKS